MQLYNKILIGLVLGVVAGVISSVLGFEPFTRFLAALQVS